MQIRNALFAALASLCTAITGTAAMAAEWPERAVTIIVPAGAGGGTDATGRIIADMLKEKFSQPFNVVNQGGGGGFIGISGIANAKPDGYTLGIVYNYAQYSLLGIGDVGKSDYTQIAQYNFDPGGITVSAELVQHLATRLAKTTRHFRCFGNRKDVFSSCCIQAPAHGKSSG